MPNCPAKIALNSESARSTFNRERLLSSANVSYHWPFALTEFFHFYLIMTNAEKCCKPPLRAVKI